MRMRYGVETGRAWRVPFGSKLPLQIVSQGCSDQCGTFHELSEKLRRWGGQQHSDREVAPDHVSLARPSSATGLAAAEEPKSVCFVALAGRLTPG